MIKLPEFNEPIGTPQQPPGVDINPNQSGQAYSALADVGGKLAAIGTDMAEKRKAVEDKNAVDQAHLQELKDFEVFQENLKLKVGTDYKGYAEAVHNWSNDRFQQTQANLPSEAAKQRYRELGGSFYTKEIVQATGDERIARAKSYSQDIINSIDETGNHIVQMGTPDSAREYMKTLDMMIGNNEHKTIDSATADLYRDRANNTVAKSILDRLYNQGLGDTKNGKQFFQQGLDLLQGKADAPKGQGMDITAHDPLLDGLLPHERSAYTDKFTRGMKDHVASNLKELNARFQDGLVAASSGTKEDPGLFPAIDAATGPALLPTERVRRYDERNAAYTTGQIRNQMAISNPSEWPGLAAGWDSKMNGVVADFAAKDPTLEAAQQPNFNKASRDAWRAELTSKGQEILKARREDAAGAVLSSFPWMNSLRTGAASDPAKTDAYVTSLLAKQDQLGIPKQFQRITTKSEAYAYASGLNNANEQVVSQTFTNLEHKYGKNYGQVFDELAADGFLNKGREGLWAAKNIDNPLDRQSAVGAIINSHQSEIAYKAKFSNPADHKAFEDAISAAVDPYTTSLAQIGGGGGSLEYSNSIRSLVTAKAKGLLATSLVPITPEEAATKAVEIVKNTHPIANGGDSSVVHPTSIGGQPIDTRMLEAYMNSHKSPEALNEMKLMIPGGKKGGEFDKLTPDEKKARYFETIQNNGRWVTNAKMDGMRLEIQTPQGIREPVRDIYNQPFEVKFADRKTIHDKRSLEATKNWRSKLMDFLSGSASSNQGVGH